MLAVRWIIITTISVIIGFTNMFSAYAVPVRETEPPLEITITTAQAETVVGEPVTWHVTLVPGEQPIDSIELRPGDSRIWTFDIQETSVPFTNTKVLTVAAIPLVNGDLTPILEAHYVVDGVAQTQLVVGDAAVHVETVEMYVDAGVIVEQGTVQEEDRLSVQVWIRNRSPFTLTLVDMHGNGADLAWEGSISSSTIAASDTFSDVLTATVTGPHPRPQLSTWYTWTDKSGTIYTRTLHLEGKEVAITDDILDRIPDELFGMIVGLIAGVLSTFLGGWVKDYLAQMSQKRVNQQHVQGLLEMVTRNSEYAANSGEKVALEPLDTIFQEEGLFTVLQKYKLNTDVYNLWSTAKRHNDGLNAPGGAQRAQSLAESAKKVRILLQTMRNR